MRRGASEKKTSADPRFALADVNNSLTGADGGASLG